MASVHVTLHNLCSDWERDLMGCTAQRTRDVHTVIHTAPSFVTLQTSIHAPAKKRHGLKSTPRFIL